MRASPVINKQDTGTWLASLASAELDLQSLYNDLNTTGAGATGATTRVNAANVFNSLAGLSDYYD